MGVVISDRTFLWSDHSFSRGNMGVVDGYLQIT